MYHFIRQYMRSLALILFFGAGLVFMPTPSQAQIDIKPGVRVGFNSSSFGGDTDQYNQALSGVLGQIGGSVDVESGRRSGFMVGGFAVVDFGGPFALQPELRYIQRGYTIDLTTSAGGQSFSADGTLKLDYIDIPVLARFEFPSGGITPHVIAGPTVGFNVTSEAEFEAQGQSQTTDQSDGTSGTDFGLEFGGGVDFGLGLGTVTIDARYGLGLSNIIDANNTNLSVSNRALMVTAGLTF